MRVRVNLDKALYIEETSRGTAITMANDDVIEVQESFQTVSNRLPKEAE
ncbi:MAG: hypothetical protein WC117_00230 [Sphaerochaetaceae bacterium]